jgi:hypothetical protein
MRGGLGRVVIFSCGSELRCEFKFCEEGGDGGREAVYVYDGERAGGHSVEEAECGFSEGEVVMSYDEWIK